MRNIAIEEFGGKEQWRDHYIKAVSSEKMQKDYAKMVEWYGGKDAYLTAVKNPVSKEVLDSYQKRFETILQKLADKRNCPVDSFEVKKLIGEYGFVVKQVCQLEDEKGYMLVQAENYRKNSMIREKMNKKYGDGMADFFAEAVEAFYRK